MHARLGFDPGQWIINKIQYYALTVTFVKQKVLCYLYY